MTTNPLLEKIFAKKKRLDAARPFPIEIIKNLNEWFRVELTYTSNAIEGNTLSRAETALVVEKNLAIEGKSIREHLEALNHVEALKYLETLVPLGPGEFLEDHLLEIHRLILTRIDDTNAGRYRSVPVRIAGSTVIMPNPHKVPDLMTTFIQWLTSTSNHPVIMACDAHYRLVSIHPFVDGNGRTARLLMNLLLSQAGYPPALIRPEDRKRYITSIEQAQLGGPLNEYYQIMYEAVERSLDIHLAALTEPQSTSENPSLLLKIGELARITGETNPTIRFWTNQGLLHIQSYTPGGYQLYDCSMVDRVKEIRSLQRGHRLTLEEIKVRLREQTAS